MAFAAGFSYPCGMSTFLQNSVSVGLVFVLWIAGLGAAAQFAKIAVMFPVFRELYPVAGPEVGLLVSLIGFLGIGLGLFAGLIVARIGFRRLLLAALVLGALMSLYQATLPTFAMMLASRLVEGASHLIIVVAAPTLIARLSSDRYRGLAMTLWSTFFGVAFAMVAWLGTPLVEAYGLAGLFVAHAIVLSISAVALTVWLPTDGRQPNPAAWLTLREILLEHKRAYSSPFVAAPAIGWLFYTLTFVSLLTVLPGLVPVEDRAFVAGSMPLAGIVTAMFCGVFILPRISAVKTVVLGFMLAVATVPLLWSGSGTSWACIVLFGMLGLVQGASFAAVPELNHDTGSQARANGALAQMGNLGNTLGTPLLLGLLAAFGISGMIWGVIACFLAGIAGHMLLQNRRRVILLDT